MYTQTNDSTHSVAPSIASNVSIPPYVQIRWEPKTPSLGIGSSRKVALDGMEEHIQWLQEFIDQNDFVNKAQLDRFRTVVKRHKEQVERASKKSFLDDYLSPGGHFKTRTLFADLTYFMKQLKVTGTEVVIRGVEQRKARRRAGVMTTVSEEEVGNGKSAGTHDQSQDGEPQDEWQDVPIGPESYQPTQATPLSDEEVARLKAECAP